MLADIQFETSGWSKIGGDLVAHVQEGAQGEPEGEALVVAHKVAYVLQQKVARPVEVGEGQVGHHHAVLYHAPLALVEPIHAGVALAGGAPTQKVHLPWGWDAGQDSAVQLLGLFLSLCTRI
jgi:hypothetical protein